MLNEFGWRGGKDFPQHAGFEPDKFAVYMRARAAPVLKRNGIVAKLDADLGENPVRRLFDPQQVFFRHHVVGGDIAHDIGPAGTVLPVAALLAACLPAAAFAALSGRV